MTAFSDETGRDWLPLKYEDGPDFCTVTLATGAAFALTVHPERMKLMEAALSASPVAQEPVATKKVYIKPLRTIVEIQTAYADQIRDWLNTSTPAPPATTAGLGADEIAVTALENARRDFNQLLPRSDTGSKRRKLVEAAARRIEEALALLSRAGDQGNSTQKDGSR